MLREHRESVEIDAYMKWDNTFSFYQTGLKRLWL
jgi:hypothetical protein